MLFLKKIENTIFRKFEKYYFLENLKNIILLEKLKILFFRKFVKNYFLENLKKMIFY